MMLMLMADFCSNFLRKTVQMNFFTGSRNILRRKILRSNFLMPEYSLPYNSSLGYFFAREILTRMILRRKVLRSDDSWPPDYSTPEHSSLEKKIPGGGKFFVGVFFAWMILRRSILR
jgi:hypothetical protein